MNGSVRLPLAHLLRRSTWILIPALPTCETKLCPSLLNLTNRSLQTLTRSWLQLGLLFRF